MGLWDTVKGWFSKKKPTVTQKTIAPTKSSIKVTDFTSGESVITTTTTDSSGHTTTTRHAYSSGGGGTSSHRSKELIQATETLEKSGKSIYTPPEESKQVSANNQDQYKLKTPENYSALSNKPFYSSTEGRRQGADMGVLMVTPKEAKQLKGSGVAYWEMESKNIDQALIEGQFANNVPYISRPINTRGLYEYNLANIIAGKEAYHQYKNIVTDFKANPEKYKGKEGVIINKTETGTQYTLSPSFFEKNIDQNQIYSNAITEAKANFKNLPKGTRRKLNIHSYGQGIAQAGVGIAEFAGTVAINMGVQTYDESNKKEFGKTRKFYFSENTALGEIATYPRIQTTTKFRESPTKYLGQKVTSPDFLGGATVIVPMIASSASSAVSNIRAFGWKAGTLETVSGFSPLRIKSGIYAEPITADTKFKVKGVKYTNDGTTTRVYSGSSQSNNIKIGGYERSALVNGNRVGGGITVTETPYIEIRAGGAIVNTGVRSTISPYTFKGTGTGTSQLLRDHTYFNEILSPKFRGGTSQVIASKGATIYTSNTGETVFADFKTGYKLTGGSSYKVDGAKTSFISGRAKPIYKTTYGDTTINLEKGSVTRDFIYSPSGKYKLQPQIAGEEYDLNKILGSESGYKSFSGGGNKGTGSKLISSSAGSVNAILPPTIKPVTTFKPTVVPVQTSTQETRTGQIYSPQTVTIKNQLPKAEQKPKIDQSSYNVVIQQTTQGLIQKSRSKRSLIPKGEVLAIPAISQKLDSLQATKTIQVKKVKLVQKNALAGVSTFGGFGSTAFDFTPPTEPVKPFVPSLMGGIGAWKGIGNIGTRPQERAYTPSFTALFYKIKGREPKRRIKTGISFRPITKGFRYTKKKKGIIRLKKIKI